MDRPVKMEFPNWKNFSEKFSDAEILKNLKFRKMSFAQLRCAIVWKTAD